MESPLLRVDRPTGRGYMGDSYVKVRGLSLSRMCKAAIEADELVTENLKLELIANKMTKGFRWFRPKTREAAILRLQKDDSGFGINKWRQIEYFGEARVSRIKDILKLAEAVQYSSDNPYVYVGAKDANVLGKFFDTARF